MSLCCRCNAGAGASLSLSPSSQARLYKNAHRLQISQTLIQVMMTTIDRNESVASPFLPSSRLQAPSSLSGSGLRTTESPSSILRQWRPQAQRNLRNQWSKLSSLRHDWVSNSSAGRSHATSLVNSYLSHSYMDAMDLGVLSDMPNIRKKACSKLMKQLELQGSQLLSYYKAMVAVVVDMLNSSRSMRCFLKATSGSPLVQFSSSSDDGNDTGDGGGIPVFTFLSVSAFEMLAEELVEMFKKELALKRLLVVELLSVSCQKLEQHNTLSWADELYCGESDQLKICSLYSEEGSEPVLPRINGLRPETSAVESEKQPNHEVLKVYLTTWLVEVNVDSNRVEEIFANAGEEMRVSFS